MSFLRNFRTFCDGTETHPNYAIYSGLVGLSAVISRRVWLPMGHYDIFPNLYVVLVGPPAARKTTAMDVAKGLIRTLNERAQKAAGVDPNDPLTQGAKLNDFPLSAESMSKEKLIQDLRATERKLPGLLPDWQKNELYSPMTIMATELSEFLMVGGAGMISFLTTIYDRSVYDYRTKNKGQEYVRGPYLNLLACTTPDWITMYLKDDIISGGFSRRALFIYETEEAKRIPIPKITVEMEQAMKDMIAYAERVAGVQGPMKLTKEAEDYYCDWYLKLRIPADPNTAGYFRSKHVQMFKLAMLISLSESPDLVVTIHHVKFAFELLSLIESRLSSVFAGMGKNELHSVAHKTLEMLANMPLRDIMINGKLEKKHYVDEKQLRGILFKDADRLGVDNILQHLIDTDKVQRVGLQQGTITRTSIVLK